MLVPLTPFVSQLLRNPLLRYLKVFFVGLKTDEVSVFTHGGNGGGATAHADVKYYPPPIHCRYE